MSIREDKWLTAVRVVVDAFLSVVVDTLNGDCNGNWNSHHTKNTYDVIEQHVLLNGTTKMHWDMRGIPFFLYNSSYLYTIMTIVFVYRR